MDSRAHGDLLERATAAIERIDRTLERQEASFERHERRFERLFAQIDQRDVVAAQRHEALMERFARSEDRVVDVLNDAYAEVGRSTSRVDDMGEAIRANTQAVLRMIDRLGPAPG